MKEEKVQTTPQGSENAEIIKLYKENVDLRKEVECLRKENEKYHNDDWSWKTKYENVKEELRKFREDVTVTYIFSVLGVFVIGCLVTWIFSDDPKYTIQPRYEDTKVIRIEKYGTNSSFVDYYINMGDSVCFRDSVGKFNIGDVIQLTK